MRVVVTGAGGQLGAAVVHEFKPHHDVQALDHAALDIADPDRVAAAMERLAPQLIINCAADNAVDAAEDHQVAALRINAFAVRSLARAARAHEAVLVHYGSDFVFDGAGDTPHTEEERPNPRSVYATSKMLGEWFAADAQAYVLRVESLFGAAPGDRRRKGSVSAIVEGLRAGSRPRVFEDRTVSPTYVPDAVRATRELVERRAPFGVYHCVNSGACTWLDFAIEAARQLAVEPHVEAVRFADAAFKAARPLYCALSNAKLAAAGVPMPTWQDALRRHISEFDTRPS